MSGLSDRIEAKIARANRAFRLSSQIVAAARDDLDGHGEWLDRHRPTWTEEVKRQRRLLNRKLTARALTRTVAGLVFAAPFAVARALALRGSSIVPRAQDHPANGLSQAPRHHIIRGLDGPLCTMKPARVRQARQEAERKDPSPVQTDAASPRPAVQQREPARERPVSIFGLVVLCFIAAGAVRAMLVSPVGEAPALAAKKAQPVPPLKKAAPLPPPRTAASMTVAKTPPPAKPPTAISGSVFLPKSSEFAPVQWPSRTVADMTLLTRPLALASEEPDPEPAPAPIAKDPVAAKPVMAKPAARPRPKRKVARRQPQPVPWWQQWSWIRLR